jgi:Cd2+/Zn2+-exporting ATPase
MTASDESDEREDDPPDSGHAHDHDHDHERDHDHESGDVNESPSTDEAVKQFSVPEMDCPSCAGKVESSVRKLDGVTEIDPAVTTGTLTVGYDPSATTRTEIVERIEMAGYAVEDDGNTVTFTVPEMDCPSCAGKVENALDSVDGVSSHETRPTSGTVVVTFDVDVTTEAAVTEAIEAAGYEVVDTSSDDSVAGADTTGAIWTSPRALKTWASGGIVLVGLVLEFALTGLNVTVATVLGSELALADLLFVGAVGLSGQEIIRNGYYSARNRNLDIDFLMSVAILGALLASLGFGEALYFEAATLAVLFSIAELLERYSMDRARNSLRELMDLSPDEATVRRDGEEVTVPVEEVEVGETVIVKPGEKIPRDGAVVNGESAVNQAPITGESVPVDKTTGDEVYAGSINEQGYIEVQVTSESGEDTLSRVIEMVEDAQANKTDREQFVERFAGYYTPAVVAFAVFVTAASPYALGTTWSTAVVHGLTLLVLACPCAFVISTPVSVVSGITSAAKNGVLIKGGNHLEAMGAVDVVAFDKTGTLTEGELTVTDVVPLHGNTEDDVLRCARGLEARSEHPIGEAIVTAADKADVPERETSGFESLTGKGVRADLDGTPHFAGKPGLFEELGFDLSHVHATTDRGEISEEARELCDQNNCLNLLEDAVPALQAQGKTVVLVGTDDELEGLIAVADEVRPAAKLAVKRLQDLGVKRTVMLTGDNERTARAIADEVGVDDYRAELLPEDKVEAIESLTAEYDGVAMVGDGINDAPALATATVGVAMGAAGTDTALETADIALLSDDLSKLPYLYELANDANGVIRQNIWASLGVKAALSLAVPFGYVPIWLAVLAGDAGMTLGVTGNAMRLSRISPGPSEQASGGTDAATTPAPSTN